MSRNNTFNVLRPRCNNNILLKKHNYNIMNAIKIHKRYSIAAVPMFQQQPQPQQITNNNNNNSKDDNCRILSNSFSVQFQKEGIELDPECKKYCFEMLEKVSRSFAIVIQQLPESIRDSICIFYLILRGLDSIEDDMQNFDKLSDKVDLLNNFHKILNKTTYSLKGIGDKKQYQELLENFTSILNVYHSLSFSDKIIIQNITQKMAFGMKQFVIKQWAETKDEQNVNTRIKTISDYDEYCYYVAGIIGNGLSEIFSKSGLENEDFYIKNDKNAINMGLFLQKTNITRDYLEDINEGRIFWPSEILSIYVDSADYFKENPTSKISLEFILYYLFTLLWTYIFVDICGIILNYKKKNNKKGRQCLNHMIFDALKHIEFSIKYLSDLENEKVFKFCAIPQIMAIATLEKCYDNSNVFKKEVKINRLLTLQIMNGINNINDVKEWFKYFLYRLNDKLDYLNDPNAKNSNDVIVESLKLLN